MPATVTFNTSTAITPSSDQVTWLKTPLAAIGLGASALVKDTTTELIYKITKGTGTYADTYIRYYFPAAGDVGMQMGTGYNSSTQALTGAGQFQRFLYYPSTTTYVRSILTSDNTFGLLQFVLTSNTSSIAFQTGFIQPTNTTLTAATIPLTQGLLSVHNPSSTLNTGYAAWSIWNPAYSYNPSYPDNYYMTPASATTGTRVNNQGIAYMQNGTAFGTRSFYMLGSSGEYISNVVSPANSNSYHQVYAVGYGLAFTEGGSQGVIPNVPVFSGGRPIGYNSNLAFCSPALAVADRIVVSQGTEEYVKVDGHGVAVRQV